MVPGGCVSQPGAAPAVPAGGDAMVVTAVRWVRSGGMGRDGPGRARGRGRERQRPSERDPGGRERGWLGGHCRPCDRCEAPGVGVSAGHVFSLPLRCVDALEGFSSIPCGGTSPKSQVKMPFSLGRAGQGVQVTGKCIPPQEGQSWRVALLCPGRVWQGTLQDARLREHWRVE